MSQQYLIQNCNLTLKEALDIYYSSHPNFYQPYSLDAESKKVFLAHDVCHLVFGCDTDMRGEIIVEQWIYWATNIGIKNYIKELFDNKSTNEAVKSTINFKSALQSLISTPALFRTFLRARKITPKWDFYNYKPYMDKRISHIRDEYRIKVI